MENNEFALRLKKLLEERKIKANELAKMTGISKVNISFYINGKTKAKQDNLYLIAKALNVSPVYLMGLCDDEQGGLTIKNRIRNKIENINDDKKLNLIESYIDFINKE